MSDIKDVIFDISIHAPTRGATLAHEYHNHFGIFQSTLPHGERLHAQMVRHMSMISIHAPTRGATYGATVCWLGFFISIHAPTRGATEVCLCIFLTHVFQSTLPHGERPVDRKYMIVKINFNPRSHTGSDGSGGEDAGAGKNFNPRSHTGSDITVYWNYISCVISIHAPTRGAT